MHVIMVRCKIKADCVEAFEAEMKAHVQATRRTEPGCVQFEVCIDKEDPTTYHLFEIYADDKAIEDHAKSPTLAAMREKLEDWAEDRTLTTATRWPEITA